MELVGDAKPFLKPAKFSNKLDEVLNSDNHKWYLDKMDPKEKERRKKAAAALKAKYAK